MIGFIIPGGKTGNVNYINKAIIWLLYREQTDDVRNGREYRRPELPTCAWTVSVPKREMCTRFSNACVTFIPVYNFVTSLS